MFTHDTPLIVSIIVGSTTTTLHVTRPPILLAIEQMRIQEAVTATRQYFVRERHFGRTFTPKDFVDRYVGELNGMMACAGSTLRAQAA